MKDIESTGRRPIIADGGDGGPVSAHAYCPGYTVTDSVSQNTQFDYEFGRALEIREGFASDSEIRFRASSGGILSALACYCLEREGMKFVLHAAMDDEYPYLNKTVISRTRDEIVRRTGSRYAPSSPCEGLRFIEEADGPCVFIGKPCDVAAVSELRETRPRLDRNLGLVLTFFCAGTPSTGGTLKLIKKLYQDTEGLEDLRYRGNGWPGSFKGIYRGKNHGASMEYDASWSFLTSYRPWRCNICPDGFGRLADLSCGDAWHRFKGDGNTGCSLVLVRNNTGRDLLKKAMQSGYVSLDQSGAANFYQAQKNLLRRREELYGRLLAMRFAGVPAPRYSGFSLKNTWAGFSTVNRARIFLGTLKRIMKYRLRQPCI